MILTLLAQNLSQGARYSPEGEPDDRWASHLRRLAPFEPDVLVLTEAVDWHRWGHRLLVRACEDLDLDPCPIGPSASGYATVILYRRARLGRWCWLSSDFSHRTTHGFTVAAWRIPGLPRPLSIASAHLDPHSPVLAAGEADTIATRAQRQGPYGAVLGDINYSPAYDQSPDPDLTQARPYNIGARTLLPQDPDEHGTPRPNREIARRILHKGFVDVAWEMFKTTGDESLLAPTARMERVDQAYVTRALRPAIRRAIRIPRGEASDHDAVGMELDTGAAVTDNPWVYA